MAAINVRVLLSAALFVLIGHVIWRFVILNEPVMFVQAEAEERFVATVDHVIPGQEIVIRIDNDSERNTITSITASRALVSKLGLSPPAGFTEEPLELTERETHDPEAVEFQQQFNRENVIWTGGLELDPSAVFSLRIPAASTYPLEGELMLQYESSFGFGKSMSFFPLDMAGPRHGWEMSAGGLHYQLDGDGEPLVFIHGGGLDARMWAREFDAFASTFNVLRYDVRGFGRSRSPQADFSHVEDLRELLDELGIQRANVVGLSLGGGIALDFALEHPERVRSLVLAAPAVSGWHRPPEIGIPFREIFRAANEGRFEDAVDRWLVSPAVNMVAPDTAMLLKVRNMVRDNIERLTAQQEYSVLPVSPPAIERLEDVSARTLVLIGDRDAEDLLGSSEMLAERIPDVRRIVLDGAGHVSNLDAPDAFSSAVDGFLASQPPSWGDERHD